MITSMCALIPFTLTSYSCCNQIPNLGFFEHDLKFSSFQFNKASYGSNGGEFHALIAKNMNSVKASRDPYADYGGYDELGFKEKGSEGEIEFEDSRKERTGVDTSSEGLLGLSGFLSFVDERRDMEGVRRLKDEEMVKSGDVNSVDLKLEELDGVSGSVGLRRRKQMMRRSSILAKQVISIQSAVSLGFISQLWVDTTSWVVLIVEVRPNLLSGESEKFLLEDVTQIGDVVLVQDESVMECTVRMVGLETLVGYNVATPTRRKIGKVKGYTFNINSGIVESLELDSFGIAIIPSALVSTYALFVEDVIEVLSDTVMVHEAAASRVQRLSKGLWGSSNIGTSIDEIEEHTDLERQPYEYDRDQKAPKNSKRKKPRQKVRDVDDEWEVPMDYL